MVLLADDWIISKNNAKLAITRKQGSKEREPAKQAKSVGENIVGVEKLHN